MPRYSGHGAHIPGTGQLPVNPARSRACTGTPAAAAPVHVQGRPGAAVPVHVQGRAQLAVPVRRGPVVPPNGRDKYAVQSDHGPMRL